MKAKCSKGQKRILAPVEEFLLVLNCLHLGLHVCEQDIAYRFGLSQPTVLEIQDMDQSTLPAIQGDSYFVPKSPHSFQNA